MMHFSGHNTALRVGTFRQQGHGMESGWQHMARGVLRALLPRNGPNLQQRGRRDADRFAADAASCSRISRMGLLLLLLLYGVFQLCKTLLGYSGKLLHRTVPKQL